MTAPRSRKQNKAYDKHRAKLGPLDCEFCELSEKDSQFISETSSFKLIRNIFPYTIWDTQRVLDHLLVVPKQHTDTLKDLTPEQAAEFVKLISEYEEQGYNVYARAPKSRMKSVMHQHTHLIKTTGVTRLVFLLRRPYFRVVI